MNIMVNGSDESYSRAESQSTGGNKKTKLAVLFACITALILITVLLANPFLSNEEQNLQAPGPEALGDETEAVCGNGICESREFMLNNCPEDCGVLSVPTGPSGI